VVSASIVADSIGLIGSLMLAAPFFATRRRRRQLRALSRLQARRPTDRARLDRVQGLIVRLILELSRWETRLYFGGAVCLVASFSIKLIAEACT